MAFKVKKTVYPLGFSDLLPEGICGYIEPVTVFTTRKSRTANTTSSDSTTHLLNTFNVKTKSKKIKTRVKLKKLTKKRKLKTKPLTTSIEALSGSPIVDQVTKGIPLAPPSKTTTIKHPPRTEKPSSRIGKVPELDINYDGLDLPAHVKNLQVSNTVEVEEPFLHKISRITERRTRKLGELLLANTAPSILAQAAATSYVNTVMSDSFNIEFEDDPSIGEAIRDITKIEVLEFFTKRLKVPVHRKEQIMTAFVEKMTTRTVDRMEKILAQGTTMSQIKTLEAVLGSRSKGGEKRVVRQGDVMATGPQEHLIERPMITRPNRKSTRI